MEKSHEQNPPQEILWKIFFCAQGLSLGLDLGLSLDLRLSLRPKPRPCAQKNTNQILSTFLRKGLNSL